MACADDSMRNQVPASSFCTPAELDFSSAESLTPLNLDEISLQASAASCSNNSSSSINGGSREELGNSCNLSGKNCSSSCTNSSRREERRAAGRKGDDLARRGSDEGAGRANRTVRSSRERQLSEIEVPRMGPASLYLLSLEVVALNIQHVQSLEGIPEEVVMMLFWGILRLGGMTERALQLFLATRHPALQAAVRQLGLKPGSRPVLPTRCCDRF